MTEQTRHGWRPAAATLVGGVLVVAGWVLTSVSWWFLGLMAIGAVGPGVLRELGWLGDHDEFQRGAAHRAGYHAFLVTAFAAFLVMAYLRTGEREIRDPQDLVEFFLALLWFTWFFSSLFSFWGVIKATTRLLRAFGVVWFLFALISNLGSEWNGWLPLLLHPLLAVPFFVLAWLAGKRPRIAGALLLVASASFVRLFEFTPTEIIEGLVFVMLVGPLLVSGVALLGTGAPEVEDEGEV